MRYQYQAKRRSSRDRPRINETNITTELKADVFLLLRPEDGERPPIIVSKMFCVQANRLGDQAIMICTRLHMSFNEFS